MDRSRLALPLLLAAAVLLGGCERRAEGPVGSDAEFFLTSGRTNMTLQQFEANLAHPLIYPRYRPGGAQVRMMRLMESRIPARVLLSFVQYSENWLGWSSMKFGFYLEEWPSDGVIELAAGDDVDIGGTKGRVRLVAPQEKGDPGSLEVAWEACGVEFLLRSSSEMLEEAEALRIAASTLEACE